jgi:hypothetical protein
VTAAAAREHVRDMRDRADRYRLIASARSEVRRRNRAAGSASAPRP